MMADPSLSIRIPSIMTGRQIHDVLETMQRDGCSPTGEILARIRYTVETGATLTT